MQYVFTDNHTVYNLLCDKRIQYINIRIFYNKKSQSNGHYIVAEINVLELMQDLMCVSLFSLDVFRCRGHLPVTTHMLV